MIKKKQLDSCLSQIDDFIKPIWKLEQYMTPFNIASSMIQHIMMNEDINGQIVADLGCGTGMLSAAMLCAGAHHVIGYEINQQAADIAIKNIDEVHGSGFDLIITDVQHHKFKGQVDTIIMNPPFGTKNENIDIIFLKKSFEYCSGNIYSLHKTATRPYLKGFGEQNNRSFKVLETYQFPLPKRFLKYHKKGKLNVQQSLDMAYTQVDFIQFGLQNKQ